MAEQVSRTITVNGDPHRIYERWADLESFPDFMPGVKSVVRSGERASRWTVRALGRDFTWDAETTMAEPGKRIAWNSSGGDLKTTGQIVFADLGNGQTSLTATVQWAAPAGVVGEALGKLSGPETWLDRALRAFKEHVEATAPARVGSAAAESATGHTLKGSEPVPGGFAPEVEKRS